MNSFHRVNEIKVLEEKCSTQYRKSSFVLIEGSRHSGKTTLISEFLQGKNGLHITVQQSASRLQLLDISNHLKSLRLKDQFIPHFLSWEELFSFMLFLSRTQPAILVFDDIHHIEKINRGFYERITELWNAESVEANLTFIAAYKTVVPKRGAEVKTENPLIEIADAVIRLAELTFDEVVNIGLRCGRSINSEMLRDVYITFGGLPRVYDFIETENLWDKSFNAILKLLIEMEFSPLKQIIDILQKSVPDKGKAVYTSILHTIAEGITNVGKIGQRIGIPATSVVKYLTMLEKQRDVIVRETPVGAPHPEKSKSGRYVIKGNFPNFWFRFIERGRRGNILSEYNERNPSFWEEIDAYIKLRYGTFVCDLLRSPANSDLFELSYSNECNEIGAIWNKNICFETALFCREKGEVHIFYFDWKKENNSIELMRDVWKIQQHFGARKAELHYFIRDDETKIKESEFIITAVKFHTGFPDEIIFRRIVNGSKRMSL